ncbi:MAG: hypothetical protein IPL55_19865 [Saprospiraceae bacterium]|nr:hypothetical protein [Saprospiraceae bacterium]
MIACLGVQEVLSESVSSAIEDKFANIHSTARHDHPQTGAWSDRPGKKEKMT